MKKNPTHSKNESTPRMTFYSSEARNKSPQILTEANGVLSPTRFCIILPHHIHPDSQKNNSPGGNREIICKRPRCPHGSLGHPCPLLLYLSVLWSQSHPGPHSTYHKKIIHKPSWSQSSKILIKDVFTMIKRVWKNIQKMASFIIKLPPEGDFHIITEKNFHPNIPFLVHLSFYACFFSWQTICALEYIYLNIFQ